MGTEAIVHVKTRTRAYDVHVTPGVLARTGELVRASAGGERAFVVSDTNVAPLYLDEVSHSLARAGYEIASFVFEAGEASKRAGTWAACLEAIAEAGLTRDDVVVALGGGVVGDLAGFAAASYMRGCAVAQVPTSLLAMVDSSVGGKTAVDLPQGKNLAGAFFQPRAVIADIECLSTIDRALVTDSCGEVIKYGVMRDRALFDSLAKAPLNSVPTDYDRLERVVGRCVELKRDVVDADERESGVRQTLNLGHTIGHAIESASDFGLGHGSSVAAGLCFMARACARLGTCTDACAERIVACVRAHGLPTGSDVPTDVLFSHALSDKKRHGDTMNVVVVRDIGHVEVERVSLARFRDMIDLGRES